MSSQLPAMRYISVYLRISPYISVYLRISPHHEDELTAAVDAQLLEHAADGGDLLRHHDVELVVRDAVTVEDDALRRRVVDLTELLQARAHVLEEIEALRLAGRRGWRRADLLLPALLYVEDRVPLCAVLVERGHLYKVVSSESVQIV